jgi:ATP-dependent RNA helicase DeaD
LTKPHTKSSPAKHPASSPVKHRAGAFGNLALSKVTLAALHEAGYFEPTPVQAGLIPRALAGADLMGQAQTGTGKTAAFAVPILERLEITPKMPGPQAIVLVPTRELAVQVHGEIVKLAHGHQAHVVAVYGGMPIRRQTEQLRKGAHVVVGTPGRVLDLLDRRTLLLDQVRTVVLDEADRMLDIGFRPDIEKILRRAPASRQTLLLSATIPPPVMRLAQRYMRDPEMLDFSPREIAVETIDQFYFTVDPECKLGLLVALLRREDPQQALIFCRTRRGTEKLHQRLAKQFERVAAIHGDLPQRVRDRVMSEFRQGQVRFLVATDVVGRGIDVTSISHIINFDIPEFCDDYVHRVGRTGRMGREGTAFTFVTPEQGSELTGIEMRINRLLKRDEIADLPTLAKAEPGGTSKAPPERKPVFGRRQRRHRRAL